MNNKNYDDIINLPRPITTNTPLSPQARAAQFAPYAALSGHRELIENNEISAHALVDLDQDIEILPDHDN